MYFWYYLQFFNLTLKNSLAKIENMYFSNRNLYIFGENTPKYCRRIIVVQDMQLVFSQVHPASHNIANGIKPGSHSKKTDKHATACSKAVCWGWSDLCEMYKLIIQQCGQRFPSLWQKSSSCLYRKIFMQVRAFERYIPLRDELV